MAKIKEIDSTGLTAVYDPQQDDYRKNTDPNNPNYKGFDFSDFADYQNAYGYTDVSKTGILSMIENGTNSGLIQTLIDKITHDDKWGREDERANNVNTLINYLLQLDSEQRQQAYNDPTSQLARLMKTGMSRAQALAILNGGQLDTSATSASADNIASTQAANNASALQSYADAFSSVFGTLGSLGITAAQLGYQIPLLRANTTAGAYANYFNGLTKDGLTSSGEFAALVEQARLSGSLDKNVNYNSFDDLATAAYNVSADRSPELYNFMHNGNYAKMRANPYAMQFAETAFNRNWSTAGAKSTDEMIHLAYDNLRKQNRITNLQVDAIQTDLTKLNQEIDFEADLHPLMMHNLRADIQSAEAGTRLTEAQTQTEQSNALLVGAQAKSAQFDTEWYEANKETINKAKVAELVSYAIEYDQLQDPVQRSLVEKRIKNDRGMMLELSRMNLIEQKASNKFWNENPQYHNAILLMKDFGLDKLVDMKYDNMKRGAGVFENFEHFSSRVLR